MACDAWEAAVLAVHSTHGLQRARDARLCALVFAIAHTKLSSRPAKTLPPSGIINIKACVAEVMRCLVMVDLQRDTLNTP
jgi:hypothetical protein